jgi:hypothetical protein
MNFDYAKVKVVVRLVLGSQKEAVHYTHLFKRSKRCVAP